METTSAHNVGAGGIRRRVAEQIYHGAGQVVAVADPLQRWRLVHDFNKLWLFGPKPSRHIRFGVPEIVSALPNRP